MIIFGTRGHFSGIGGVENSIRYLTQEAVKREIPTAVVCRDLLPNESMDRHLLKLPNTVQTFLYSDEKSSRFIFSPNTLLKGGHNLAALYVVIKKNYPKATVVVRNHLHVLAAKAAGFADIRYLVPSLVWDQTSEEIKSVNIFEKPKLFGGMIVDSWIQRQALKCSRLFVFSELMKRQIDGNPIERIGGSPVKLVRPGVDSSRFRPASKREKEELRIQLGLPIYKKIFLLAGRLVNAKGIEYCLDAIAQLPNDSMLILIGNGSKEKSIRMKIEKHMIQSRVTLREPTSVLENFYRASDVFLMSSTYEPFGQTTLEAIACGIPVVAFHESTGVATATNELLLDHSINYAQELTAKALAKCMLTATEQRKPSEDIQSIYQRYSWSKLFDELCD